MRGEELPVAGLISPMMELPPHARRREVANGAILVDLGITSACAEKRVFKQRVDFCDGNYLRMRGEESAK